MPGTNPPGGGTIDTDASASATALTDGLLLLRYLFGFRGATLSTDAVDPNCDRCTPEEIEDYVESILALLDVDGDGTSSPLTDGLLVFRYLFGFRGTVLVVGAIDPDCARCEVPEIEAYIQALLDALTLDSISPDSIDEGSGNLALTVHGSGFIDPAVVRFDGVDLATSFVGSSELGATVPSQLLVDSGSFPIQVVNPNGVATPAVLFSVDAPLALATLSPAGVAAGSPEFTLTLAGEGFKNGAVAKLDGAALATDFLAAGMLTAAVPAASVAATGNLSISVENPGSDFSNALPFTVKQLSITSVDPSSGPVGESVTVTGTGLDLLPVVAFDRQGGGTLGAPSLSSSPTTMQVMVPAGAATGSVDLLSGALVVPGPVFTVTTSKDFELTAGPPIGTLIQGESAVYSIRASTANGFTGLITLSHSGIPAGITASFAPPQITPGQHSLLTLQAPAGQAVGSTPFTVTGTASIEGQSVVRQSALSVNVVPLTTSFKGRAVSADPVPRPLQGVIVTFLGVDPSGNPTGCSVPPVHTDFAGNYVFTNLPAACTGAQLVGFDGLHVTNPAGWLYTGVNLRFVIVENQITIAILTHLIRIDTAESVLIEQNAPGTQTFTFATIPGLRVVVYPGTILTKPDLTTPDPFELTAVRVPVDRLPEYKLMPDGVLFQFIVSFQPVNAFASQPVTVDYANIAGNAPGTQVVLLTLDPTQGMMVMYGTGTVSPDGLTVVADPDPANPGKRFGITHFDWHGPVVPVETGQLVPTGDGKPGACVGTGPCESCVAQGPNSVEYATGVEQFEVTEAVVSGIAMPVALVRFYRSSLSSFAGPFGFGGNHNFAYSITPTSSNYPPTSPVINLIHPSGRRFPYQLQPDGTYTSSQAFGRGSKIEWDPGLSQWRLDTLDGTTLFFFSFSTSAPLSAIEDRHGNRTELTFEETGVGFVPTRITATNGERIELEWDNQGRIVSILDTAGRQTLYAYDPTNLRLETVTDPMGGVTTYGYDDANRLTSVTDARGVTRVTKQYNAQGRVIQETFPDGGVTTYAYTTASDTDPTSPVIGTVVTDPRGNATRYRFTPEGELVNVTDALGQTVAFVLDPVTGRVASRRGAAGCPVCGTSGVNESFQYDALGRVTKRIDALTNETTFTYDGASDRVESVLDPTGRLTSFLHDSFGDLLTLTDPALNDTEFTYDEMGNLETATGAEGTAIAAAYDSDGRLQSMTDPAGRVTEVVRDDLGRAVELTSAVGSVTTQYDDLDRVLAVTDDAGRTVAFAYDAVGNLLEVTDPNGNTTSMVYDDLNRVIEEIDAEGRSRLFSYDLGGNLTEIVERDGRSLVLEHDVVDRLSRAAFEDGTEIRYEYDAAGRLLAVEDSTYGRIERSYDAAGRLVREVTVEGVFEYNYDGAGRRLTRTGADGLTSYTYTQQGLLEAVANGAMGATFNYDGEGRSTLLELPHGVTQSWTYNAGQLEAMNFDGPGGFAGSRAMSYDEGGRIAEIAGTQLSPPLPSTQHFTYGAGNRIASLNGRTFTHDGRGRLVADGIRTYRWDDRDQLVSTTGPEGITAYQYDGLGRRVARTQVGVKSRFFYDSLEIARIENGAISTDVLRGAGIDEVLAARSDSQVLTYVRDHLDSVIALAKGGGGQLFLSYDEFGTASGSTPNIETTFLFTGRERDANGLTYLRARYQDPSTGRFLSKDPLGFLGDVNGYLYANSSPLDTRDPLGLLAWTALDEPGPEWLEEEGERLRHQPELIAGRPLWSCSFDPNDDSLGSCHAADPPTRTFFDTIQVVLEALDLLANPPRSVPRAVEIDPDIERILAPMPSPTCPLQ